ncbi:unnamed protein product, partial [Rotaria magnacalcarata]
SEFQSKNYTFIVLAVYDLKLMHSSFLRRTIKNLFIRRFRNLFIRRFRSM